MKIFSEYTCIILGLFAYFRIRNESKEIISPYPNLRFDMNEEALPYGIAFEVNYNLRTS